MHAHTHTHTSTQPPLQYSLTSKTTVAQKCSAAIEIQKYDQPTELLTWVGARDSCVSKNETTSSPTRVLLKKKIITSWCLNWHSIEQWSAYLEVECKLFCSQNFNTFLLQPKLQKSIMAWQPAFVVTSAYIDIIEIRHQEHVKLKFVTGEHAFSLERMLPGRLN